MKKCILLAAVLFSATFMAEAQTNEQRRKIKAATNVARLEQLSDSLEKAHAINYSKALQVAQEQGQPIRVELPNGGIKVLDGISEEGQLIYIQTDNLDAARSSRTDLVWASNINGYNLDGTGINSGVWEAGGNILASHQEFGSRVTVLNGGGVTYHATHVAGTIGAVGVNNDAKGMAYNSTIDGYTATNDESEMAAAAANGMLLSNHSYGFRRGWNFESGGWEWLGNPNISTQEDYVFGFYNNVARDWDQITYNAPYYLPVKSAGNDRNDGPGNGVYPQDGPYDCINGAGLAKNILTVGATNDVNNYTGPSSVTMSSFSCWGPTDDGRIKPDLVANGVNLFSSSNASNQSYGNSSGTSMSAPTATGSLVLLQQHYSNTHSGNLMKATTIKALAIHTTREAGAFDGPDYAFGWGLLDTKNAADVIAKDSVRAMIGEYTLTNQQSNEMTVYATGQEPLEVTVVWADPAGTPVATAQLDPTDKMLVHDLDVRIIRLSDSTEYLPWKLNGASPALPATKTDNDVDNVEKIQEMNPIAGDYSIVVTHKGTLTTSTQDYSLIVTGIGTADTVFTCKGTINNNSTEGTLTDGSGAASYSNNLDCRWTVAYPETAIYNIDFVSLSLAAGDTLVIYDGPDAAANVLATYTSATTVLPASFLTTGSSFYVRFVTDNSQQGQGWTLNYSSDLLPEIGIRGAEQGCKGQSLFFDATRTKFLNTIDTWAWSADPGLTILSPVDDDNINVELTTEGLHNIYLIGTNVVGSDTHTIAVLVEEVKDYPQTLSFENSAFPQTGFNFWNWTTDIEAGSSSTPDWERTTDAAYDGAASVRVANSSPPTFSSERALISPAIDMTTGSAPFKIQFRYAFAPFTGFVSTAKLVVYVSPSCGAGWFKLKEITGNQLATGSVTFGSTYIPAPSDWKPDEVNIIAFSTSKNLKVKFVFENANFAGHFYLDDVRFDGTVLSLKDGLEVANTGWQIVPNPGTGYSQIMLDSPAEEVLTVTMSDMLGRSLGQSTIAAGQYQINLKDIAKQKLPAGVYIVRIQADNRSISARRFVISDTK